MTLYSKGAGRQGYLPTWSTSGNVVWSRHHLPVSGDDERGEEVSIAIVWTISCTRGTVELPCSMTCDDEPNTGQHGLCCKVLRGGLPETLWLGKETSD